MLKHERIRIQMDKWAIQYVAGMSQHVDVHDTARTAQRCMRTCVQEGDDLVHSECIQTLFFQHSAVFEHGVMHELYTT